MKKTPPSPLTKLAFADPYSELAKSQKLPTSPSDDKETISKHSLRMESNSPSPNAVDAMLVNKGSKDCNKRSADCTPLNTSTKQKKREAKIKDFPGVEAHAEAAIHHCDINSRIRMLFAKEVISKTCMSARIFACYTLYIEQQQGSNSSTKMQETPSRITRRSHSTQLPILSFLQALVCVESTSLGDKPVQRKLVQFSAYDGSSTKPPRDSVMGSHISRQASVDAMVDALNDINKLLSLTQNDNRNTVIESLQSLSNFLALLETKTKENDSEHKKLRQECAKSMPIEWDQNRFTKAARLYRQDVNKIYNCLQQQKQEAAAKTVRKSLHEFDVKLNLQIKLAESMGRTIRYHLRRLFNPIYGPITLDETFEEQRKVKNDNDAFRHPSKMSEILQMRHPDWYSAGSNSAVADGSVSAVLNVALETIVNYFGAELFLAGSTFVMPTIPTSFCNSPAAKRGIKEITENVSDEAMVTIVNETVDAQQFLAAAKACRFIIELLNWPGVEEEISRLGGWTLIEKCATQFHLHCLDKFSPNDAHLSVLKNVPVLLERSRQCWNNMQNAAKDCTDELDNMWIRFQCDQYSTVPSNKKSRRNKKRSGVTIKEVLVEGLQHHMFPNIVEPEEYEDESEGEEG
eukprot:CAMPEP_0178902366 /NCGR_PEP_ID=MMETSP0786-20121207/4563_1 /TAXON_ID=186022 /ORGANISM="Thalassionema frauenfeldii, Strain CCMP 1798" /LENGTH=630 /DNA_ID=CAMNT_0020573621 /DNA_START=100 /DNA_END=1993 /DNA_ORIENTATION=-